MEMQADIKAVPETLKPGCTAHSDKQGKQDMGKRDGDLGRARMFYMEPREDTLKRATGSTPGWDRNPRKDLVSKTRRK